MIDLNLDSDIDWAQYETPLDETPKLICGEFYVDAVIDHIYGPQSKVGVDFPWPKTRAHLRLRPGEVSLWAGYNGSGKSLLLNQIILSVMAQGETACLASMEMTPIATLARMCRQASGVNQPSEDYFRAFHAWLHRKLWFYDQQGSVTPERIVAVARYCASGVTGGCPTTRVRHLVIDSLMQCGINVDDYNTQKAFVGQLCAHARDTGMHIHLVAHARKSAGEHEKVGKMDVKGASEITDQVDNVFTVWRNKPKEERLRRENKLDDDKPDLYLSCEKNRHGDWEGPVYLWYHPASQQFTENDLRRPQEFFKYTKHDPERAFERECIQEES